jgi:uncharacterized membrane protein YqgA involved in biofilm formation
MNIPGLGTVINAGLIVLGGLIGLVAGRRLTDRLQRTLLSAMGVSIMFMSVGGAMAEMLTMKDGAFTTRGTMMMILSLALGALAGELLDLEGAMERFGAWLKEKTGNSGDAGFTGAFVDASLTVCVGAMAVIGAINDGIRGDITVLVTKGILDCVIILVMTGSLGKGCIFSAIPVAVFQGCITLLARLMEPLMTAQALSNLSLVGSILIFGVGLNMTFGKKLRVANLLPAIVFAVAFALVPGL